MLLTEEEYRRFNMDPTVMLNGVNISAYKTEVLVAMALDKENYSEADRIKIENILKKRRNAILADKVYSNYKPLPEDFDPRKFQKEADFIEALNKTIDEIHSLLLEKNRKYGNSVSEPVGVFSRLSPIEAINVRIDDKLARIRSGQPDETEDSELDLIGYLIIKRILRLYECAPSSYVQPSEDSSST